MNASHDVERLISEWLVEEAPIQAPDRVLGQAAAVIDRTRQRRYFVAWREPMGITKLQLLAGAAVLIVALLGAGIAGRASAPSGGVGAPGVPTPTDSPTAGVTIEAFRAARNAVCSRYVQQAEPLKAQLDGVYDGLTTAAARGARQAVLDDFAALYQSMVADLRALEVPKDLQADHGANIAGFEDVRALLVQISDLVGQNKLAEASALDQATDPISLRIEGFEKEQFLQGCP